MEVVEICTFVTDILLVLSLVYFGYLQFRAPNSSAHSERAVELENSIRALISHAEEAGTELNKELKKRQRNLEQILFDLETQDQKIHRNSNLVDEQIQALQAALKDTRQQSVEIAQTLREPNRSTKSMAKRKVVKSTKTKTRPRRVAKIQQETEILEAKSIELSSEAIIDESSADEEKLIQSQKRGAELNVFGEPVETTKAQNLTRQIEVEVRQRQPRQVTQDESREQIRRIYEQAKDLFRTGSDMATVAAKTRLPKAALEKIQDIVIEEMPEMEALASTPPEKSARDDRLGVLSGMKRSTQTL